MERDSKHRALRVLVVDDERALAESLRMILADEHEVTAVTHAEEALAELRAGKTFDVVLCDLMMPEVSGMTFFAELPPSLQRRVVFLTGGAFNRAMAEFLERVPNTCIEKPFSIEAIQNVVRTTAARAEG